MKDEFRDLIFKVKDIVRSSRRIAAQNVNSIHIITNYEIGRLIVEHEQKGSVRAQYGEVFVHNMGKGS